MVEDVGVPEGAFWTIGTAEDEVDGGIEELEGYPGGRQ